MIGSRPTGADDSARGSGAPADRAADDSARTLEALFAEAPSRPSADEAAPAADDALAALFGTSPPQAAPRRSPEAAGGLDALFGTAEPETREATSPSPAPDAGEPTPADAGRPTTAGAGAPATGTRRDARLRRTRGADSPAEGDEAAAGPAAATITWLTGPSTDQPAGATAPASLPRSENDPASAAPVATAVRSETRERPRSGFVWGARQWAITASVAFVVAIVIASVLVAQMITHNNEVADALAGLQSTEAQLDPAQQDLDAAVAAYGDQSAASQNEADSLAPSIEAVDGMSDPDAYAAAAGALGTLRTQLEQPAPAAPEPYARGDIDTGDLDALAAATATAQDQISALETAAADTDAATAALQQQTQALIDAQRALGASLPDAAATIVDENPLPQSRFGTDVTDAADAVVAAQDAGGTGADEMVAYAAAVTALRDEEARLEELYPWLAPQPDE